METPDDNGRDKDPSHTELAVGSPTLRQPQIPPTFCFSPCRLCGGCVSQWHLALVPAAAGSEAHGERLDKVLGWVRFSGC